MRLGPKVEYQMPQIYLEMMLALLKAHILLDLCYLDAQGTQ